MERDGHILEPELVRETEFAETEKVFAKFFREVTANELIAAVVEGADTILADVLSKSRALRDALAAAIVVASANNDLQEDRQDGLSCAHEPHRA